MTDSVPTPAEIKGARAKLGLTQTAFAQKVGVTLREVQRWEAGAHKPTGLALRSVRRWVKRAEGGQP